METQREARSITITGRVQGVGFRPFVYRLALQEGLAGHVENTTGHVRIFVQGPPPALERFISRLKSEKPPIAVIAELVTEPAVPGEVSGFAIRRSRSESGAAVMISPDVPVCGDCLEDLGKQPRRIAYPFTNCTNCGPRYTIIKGLPYDRKKTTMSSFKMCKDCEAEYEDPADRRFHAQPVACADCGPRYTLYSKNATITGIGEILNSLRGGILTGGVYAVKGLGGFNLICSALDEAACRKLRDCKRREEKPFAVMFGSEAQLRQYCHIGKIEEAALTSAVRPIVLLRTREQLAESVSRGLASSGALLPYTPFQHLLFEGSRLPPLVFTSANIHGQPIITEADEVRAAFPSGLDGILDHDRPIFNRVDDSVVHAAGGRIRIIRRSRGLVPDPVYGPVTVDGLLAFGSDLKNTFALGKDRAAVLGPQAGDLEDEKTLRLYEQTLDRFCDLYRTTPHTAVCDLHPGYASSIMARKSGLPLIEVQHHHAHIASVLFEHGLAGPVLGVAFDGTGYGPDGAVWGGEFFISDMKESRRINHFDYFQLPGGDAAAREPWRMAVSLLYASGIKSPAEIGDILDIPPDEERLRFLLRMLQTGTGCLPSSSAGRLFDAVSALVNVCTHNSYEAEAAMKLEQTADTGCTEFYEIETKPAVLTSSIFQKILEDRLRGLDVRIVAAKFHNTLAEVVKTVALNAKICYNVTTVVLSGGVFQNRFLLDKCIHVLQNEGFKVFSNCQVPVNDGGLALGQLAAAAAIQNK